MDFLFTEEQEKLRAEVRAFCEEEVPKLDLRAMEAEGTEPVDANKKVVEKGWYGMPFPKEYGGMGRGVMEMAIISEVLGTYGYPGLFLVTVFNTLNVLHNGSEAQKRDLIPKVIRGEVTVTISITEPNAGSDVSNIATRAVADGDEFVLNGQKIYQSGAAGKNNIMLMATRTDTSGPKTHGITLFLVPSATKGITFVKLDSLGRRIGGLYEVFLEDARIPKKNIIGELHHGWKALIGGLATERAAICGGYVGQAQAGLNHVVNFAKKALYRGKPLGSYTPVAHGLADLQTELQAARVLMYRGLWMAKEGIPNMQEVSMAKMFVSNLVRKIGDFAMEISRGYGYLLDLPLERLWRESRISTVAGGSNQMMRNAIARAMGLKVI